MNTRILQRSRDEKMIMGVCGGLGLYLGIDPTLVRLFFVLLALSSGWGFFIYAILVILMPLAPLGESVQMSAIPFWDNAKSVRLAGLTLVVVGSWLMLIRVGGPFLRWLDPELAWPILLVIAGVVLLARALRS